MQHFCQLSRQTVVCATGLFRNGFFNCWLLRESWRVFIWLSLAWI